MPELPEVETVRRGLAPHVEGQRIEQVVLARGDLRIPFPEGFVRKLEGRSIESVQRRAKYLLLMLDDGAVWVVHLGMSGRFCVLSAEEAEIYAQGKHDHVWVALADGKALLYTDPRRFGLMTWLPSADAIPEHSLFAKLAPEPLSGDFSVDYLRKTLQGRTISIKQALMNAHLVVGVGNIYASEVLFRVGIHPKRKARDCTQHAEKLVPAIKAVLSEAIESGGSTLKDYLGADGEAGYFQHRFAVYGREGKACVHTDCHGTIEKITQSNRSTFFCAECQK